MKRKSIRRLSTVFLSLFLVCICLATVFVFPVSATATSDNDYVYRTDYKTKDKKPTYTATLNENNRLLKELNKKENFVLKKVRNEGKDWVNDAFALANAIKNSSVEDVDWKKIDVENTKKLIISIVGIWGFDGIAGAVLDGIESLIYSGQAPLSEVQVLSDDIDKRFNAISDQLYDIEDQLGTLSNRVTSSVNDVLSGTQTQINNLEAKQILRSFMSSGEGNFSYLEYSNYLYGNKSNSVNASEAYYILLLKAIQSGASNDVIEYYYNKLFESIYTNIAIYNQYYYGEIAGLDKSIAAYYYDYLLYNPNLIDEGTSAEYQALLFALDLYTTYVYSYEILEICFAYQTTNLYVDASLENRNISDIDTYEYADGKLITYSTIQAELEKMQENLVYAEEQVAEDIAYVLGMKDSYIVVDENGDIHSIGNYGESFGNVASSQTIYLNIIPDEICELFTLNADNLRYYVNGVEYNGANKAIIDVSKIYSDTFTATITYGRAEVYSIKFTNIDTINENSQKTPIYEFSGGSGTIDDPYLISNAIQFKLVEDNLDASYQLISNIVVNGTHSPIGTEKKPFIGTFNGNGYSIRNLSVESLAYDSTNITMNPTTGMFGTIGKNGIVQNLTLNALSVSSDYNKDDINPENDNSYYCVGGIAGTNRGVISNCIITENSNIYVRRNKQVQDSRNVSIYVGGIAGNNSGIIEYCTVDGLSINATSYHYYYNESINKNEHSLNVGGITAITYNTIQNCRVSENTSLSAYAKSIADSQDREKPILSVYVGGVVADDAATQFLSNVYSACNIIECKGEIYNEGTYLGEHRYSWDNVFVKKGLYYPTFFPLSNLETVDEYEMNFYLREYLDFYNKNYKDSLTAQAVARIASKELKAKLVAEETKANLDALTALNGKIVSTYTDTAFTLDDDKLYISVELVDNICDINSKYLTEYFNKLIDEENEVKNIKFIDATGNAVDATIVGYYGFNTYHESVTAQTITVKVFFYVDDTLMSDDVTLVVKAKELVDWKIEDFIDTTFDKGVTPSACLDEIFKYGFKIVYIYSNGQREEYAINEANRSTVDIDNLVTSEYGVKTITIKHNEQPNGGKLLGFDQTIEFACHHTNSDFIKVETVDADCKFFGYEIWKCNKDGVGCGEVIHKNYVKGDHAYVVKSGQEATCHEAGYTQEVYCSVCNIQFVSSEWIQALPHNYVSSSESAYKANESYPAAEYHYCTNGNHFEAHQYTVSEYVDENGTLVYLYSCFCGYENPVTDYNIITNEKGEKPQLIITNGYVLNVGDEVVVYVQLLNNPEFIGATFGIRYDSGLELIDYEEGNTVPKTLSVCNEVYDGYNFLWAKPDEYSEEDVTWKDGYLLKLTFRYIDEGKKEQHISVVYGMSNGSEGGFCTLDGGYHMLMTQSGTISVVEHLPGDVNNDGKGDGVVDIMDATYIAWYIVGKPDEEGNPIQVNAKYADVNLDGTVNLLDVIAILQSISGRYGTSLLSSEYKLFFNLNGFICEDVDESVMVEFYDENGNRTKWSEDVDFAKYEVLMKQLGYTFVGWYTRMDCTCTGVCVHVIEATDFITYDKYQGNQTLYARWEKNKIVFDMGGANCEQFDEIVYSKAEHENTQVTLDEPTWSYDIDYIVEENEYYDDGRIFKDFLGWKDENGNDVTKIDLSKENLGTVKLTAVWSEYKWTMPDRVDAGYYNITEWFADEYRKNQITNINADNVVNIIVNGGCKIYGQRNPIEYTITYENTHNVVNKNNTKYYITTETFTLLDLSGYTGHDFDYWADSKGNKVISITKGTRGDITLTAKWKVKTYIITFDGIDDPTFKMDGNSTKVIEYGQKYGSLPSCSRKGYQFVGWYTSKYGGTKVDESSEMIILENHILFPRFEVKTYTVSFVNNSGSTVASQTASFGSTLELVIPTHTYDGYYNFAGWSDNTYTYSNTYKIVEDRNITLTAIWNQTFADYMYIFSADDFKWHIGNNLEKSSKPDNCGFGKYMLLNDINLGNWNEGWGYTYWASNNESTTLNGKTCFTGVFDGQNHTIKYKLRIGKTNLQSWAFGLFPVTDGATIKNLKVNADLSTYDPQNRGQKWHINNDDRAEDAMVGGLVGYAKNTIIENCSVSGQVIYNSDGGGGDTCVAGVVGYAYNSMLKNCSSSAEVYARGFYVNVAGVMACYYNTSYIGLIATGKIQYNEDWLAGGHWSGNEVTKSLKVL